MFLLNVTTGRASFNIYIYIWKIGETKKIDRRVRRGAVVTMQCSCATVLCAKCALSKYIL